MSESTLVDPLLSSNDSATDGRFERTQTQRMSYISQLKRCSGDNCDLPPIIYCDCQGYHSYMCSNHQMSHMMIEAVHNFNPLIDVLTASKLSVVQSQITDVLKYLNSFQEEIVKSALALTESIYAYSHLLLTEVNTEKEKYQYLLMEVSKRKCIDKEEYLKIQQIDTDCNSIFHTFIETFVNEINNLYNVEIFKTREDLDRTSKEFLEENESPTSPSKLEIQEPQMVEEETKITQDLHGEDDDYVFFSSTKHKKSNLVCVSLYAFKLVPVMFTPSRKFSGLAQACKIQKDIYFYYDSQHGKSNADIFIINFQTNSYKKVSEHCERQRGACVMKNNWVYVFGGYVSKTLAFLSSDLSSMKGCERFDLSTNTWKQIADLPVPSYCNMASMLNNKIYVVGRFFNPLLRYDTDKNIYHEIIVLSQKEHYKVICDKWVLVDDDSLYEIGEGDDVLRYRMSNKLLRSSLLIGCTFRKGKYIYIVLMNEQLLRIDTKLRKIEDIKYTYDSDSTFEKLRIIYDLVRN